MKHFIVDYKLFSFLVISLCLGKNMSRINFDRDAGKKSQNRECPAKIGTVGNPGRH